MATGGNVGVNVEELQERMAVSEAALANLRLNLADRQNEIMQLKQELAEARRNASGSAPRRGGGGGEHERLQDRLAYLQKEVGDVEKREQVLLKERVELLAAQKELQAKFNELSKKVEMLEGNNTSSKRAKTEARPKLPPPAPAPVPPPQPSKPQQQQQQQLPPTQLPDPGEDSATRQRRLFIQQLYQEQHVFRLLEAVGSGPSAVGKRSHFDQRDVAMQLTAVFVDETRGIESFVLCCSKFLCSGREDLVESALAVISTLLSSWSDSRVALCEALSASLSMGVEAGEGGVMVDDDRPWASLWNALLRMVSLPKVLASPAVTGRLLGVLGLVTEHLLEAANDASVSALLPLLDSFLPTLLSPMNGAVLQEVRLQALKLLLSMVHCDSVYKRCRQTLLDGQSVLRYVALLMSMDQPSLEASMELKRTAVRVFSVIVGQYADWCSCTCVTPGSGPDARSSGSGANNNAGSTDGDLGPRLISLLHEQIMILRRAQQSGDCAPLLLDMMADLVQESFFLLLECAKDPNVEVTFFNKMFRQLYITSLVALSTAPPHPHLWCLQPHAQTLLSSVQSSSLK